MLGSNPLIQSFNDSKQPDVTSLVTSPINSPAILQVPTDKPSAVPPVVTTSLSMKAPIPLTNLIRQRPEFPLDSLSPMLKAVTLAIVDASSCPIGLVAPVVLGVASLAIQGHADVVSKHGLTHPLSLDLLTIGKSGERKSRIYKLALAPAIQYAMEFANDYKESMKRYKRQMDIHDHEYKKIIQGGFGAMEKDRKLQLLMMPERPIEPTFICSDPTVDGLITLFLKGRPSLGLFNSEAAQFVGGYSLNEENRDRTTGFLNKFWDAEPVDRVRVKDGEIYTLYGRRLAVCLMLQPDISLKLYSMKSILDIGWFSRLLVSYPESAIGTRFDPGNQEPDVEIPPNQPPTSDSGVLHWYNWTLFTIFSCPLPIGPGKPQELQPSKLYFDDEAKELWSMYHDLVESRQRSGNEYHSITGFASKMAEHASRIAGVMKLVENFNAYKMNPDSVRVDSSTFVNATVIVDYFAEHLLNIINQGEDSVDLNNAIKLEAWLNNNVEGEYVHSRMIERLGPSSLRGKQHEIEREAAIGVLLNNGYLVRVPPGTVIKGIKTRADSTIWQFYKTK